MRINRAFIVSVKGHSLFAPLIAFGVSILFAIIIASGLASSARAYVLEGTSWPSGSVVTFQMGLGSAGRTLIDGNTSWDTAAAPAINAWDTVMARLRFN